MLPSVLEVFVVWHPDDGPGQVVADALLDHFHGTAFTGLIGGAVEVYVRSQGWAVKGGPPRSILLPDDAALDGVALARYVAVVPVLGLNLARAVERRDDWCEYVRRLTTEGPHLKVIPVRASGRRGTGRIDRLLGRYQQVTLPVTWPPTDPGAQSDADWRRDIVQILAQFVAGSEDPLQVFVSHTRLAPRDGAPVWELTELVRDVITHTRLAHFFDATSLQVGGRWVDDLRANAARGALLALRTDLYASRAWCQEEVRVAKQHGVPMVVLDALVGVEERGCFLMDHVRRVRVQRVDDGWSRRDVSLGLGLLVDEALKRALWRRQEESGGELPVAWWAPHAPEPLTFTHWLLTQQTDPPHDDRPLRILHPDPPLGKPECQALEELLRVRGSRRVLDVMTPRQLAARGGGLP